MKFVWPRKRPTNVDYKPMNKFIEDFLAHVL